MNKLKVILFSLFLSLTMNINAQIDAATALIAMEELDVTVENAMNSLGLITENAVGDSGNMILSALSRLREDIKSTIGETDRLLRGNQQLLFDNLTTEVDNFSEIAENSIVDVDAIATRVTSAVNDFFGKKREPRILTYKTPTYTVGSNNSYVFNVIGEDFDRSYEYYLEVNGEKKKIDQVSQNKMKIIIPAETMNKISHDSIRFIKAKFVFKYKKGWIFKKKTEKPFEFVIPCVPEKIGTAVAYYEQKKPQIEYFPFKNYTAHKTSGGSNWRGKKKTGKAGINILPTLGRFIDPTSVKVTSWRKRYGGGYTINTITEQYIRGSIYCKGQNKPYGGGGSSTLKLTYREFKTEYPLTKSQTESVRLDADNLSVIELPDPIDGNRPNLNYVKVLTFDGREHIITTSNPSPYFKLSQNALTDDLELKFKL
jgi:hypothetical protein